MNPSSTTKGFIVQNLKSGDFDLLLEERRIDSGEVL
jgi:hypothetical protein